MLLTEMVNNNGMVILNVHLSGGNNIIYNFSDGYGTMSGVKLLDAHMFVFSVGFYFK